MKVVNAVFIFNNIDLTSKRLLFRSSAARAAFSTHLLPEPRLSWLRGGAHQWLRGRRASCTGRWDVSINVPTPDTSEMSLCEITCCGK